jgi:hypothetical protein
MNKHIYGLVSASVLALILPEAAEIGFRVRRTVDISVG